MPLTLALVMSFSVSNSRINVFQMIQIYDLGSKKLLLMVVDASLLGKWLIGFATTGLCAQNEKQGLKHSCSKPSKQRLGQYLFGSQDRHQYWMNIEEQINQKCIYRFKDKHGNIEFRLCFSLTIVHYLINSVLLAFLSLFIGV